MNPNATPENIAAAQAAVVSQTQDTVAAMEAARGALISGRKHRDELDRVMNQLESVLAAKNAGPAILTSTLKVRFVDGVDKEGSKRIVTLSAEDGSIHPLQLEVFTDDPRLLQHGEKRFTLELREIVPSQTLAEKVETGKVTIPAAPAANPNPTKPKLVGDASLAGTQRLSEAEKKAPNQGSRESTGPITGTTGSHGSNDASQRFSTAAGGPPNPADPNLTGPSSDAGQATKGEIVDGLQTGGTSGAGTGKGETERAAAREAGQSEQK